MVGWAKDNRGIFEYLFLSSFSFWVFQNLALSVYVSPSHISIPLRELSPMKYPSIHLFFWFRLWLLSFMVYLFFGFCLLVAFVLLVKGLFIFTFIETISRRCIDFWPPLVSHCFLFSFGMIYLFLGFCRLFALFLFDPAGRSKNVWTLPFITFLL